MDNNIYDENDGLITPSDINCEAPNVIDNLVSKEKYLMAYQTFIQWMNSKNTVSFSENVFMAYFKELSTKYKPNSLWCIYSMLKTTVRIKNNVDIQGYSNLVAFIKKQTAGFKCKKARVLSSEDIEKFIKEAPDDKYLATKVALIFGISGACTRRELANISETDVENHGQMLLVKVRKTNKMQRSFCITGSFYEIVKRYESARSPKGKTDRYFLNYQNGKCSCQPIGVNKFGCMPKEIAKFLGLEKPETYTGRSFRRTTASLLAHSGSDILTLKRHGGWRNRKVSAAEMAESSDVDSIESDNESAKIAKRKQSDSEAGSTTSTSAPNTSNYTLGPSEIKIEHITESSDEDSISKISAKLTKKKRYNDPLTEAGPTTSARKTSINKEEQSEITIENENISIENLFNGTDIPAKVINYNFTNCTFTNCFTKSK